MLGYNFQDDETIKWLELSANQGFEPSFFELALKYYEGSLINKDLGKAFSLFKLSADQGNTKALEMVGVMYCKGEGVKKDFIEGIKMFRLAKEKSNDIRTESILMEYFALFYESVDVILEMDKANKKIIEKIKELETKNDN